MSRASISSRRATARASRPSAERVCGTPWPRRAERASPGHDEVDLEALLVPEVVELAAPSAFSLLLRRSRRRRTPRRSGPGTATFSSRSDSMPEQMTGEARVDEVELGRLDQALAEVLVERRHEQDLHVTSRMLSHSVIVGTETPSGAARSVLLRTGRSGSRGGPGSGGTWPDRGQRSPPVRRARGRSGRRSGTRAAAVADGATPRGSRRGAATTFGVSASEQRQQLEDRGTPGHRLGDALHEGRLLGAGEEPCPRLRGARRCARGRSRKLGNVLDLVEDHGQRDLVEKARGSARTRATTSGSSSR